MFYAPVCGRVRSPHSPPNVLFWGIMLMQKAPLAKIYAHVCLYICTYIIHAQRTTIDEDGNIQKKSIA